LCQLRPASASGQTPNTTAPNSVTFVATLTNNHEEGTTAIDQAFFLDQLANQLNQ
jgi:hypothetical protein